MKEAKFIQTSTAKEKELKETIAKLQVAEAELKNTQKAVKAKQAVWGRNDETIEPVSSTASPTVSHAHSDVSEEVSKSEI